MNGFKRKTEGLCHISHLRNERVKDVADVVNRGDNVKVKVVKIENNRIGLSMKEVDQRTGEDLNSQETPLAEDAVMGMDNRRNTPWMNPEREPNQNKSRNVPVANSAARSRVRLSTPERWELQQMKGAGAITYADMPDFDKETVSLLIMNLFKITILGCSWQL